MKSLLLRIASSICCVVAGVSLAGLAVSAHAHLWGNAAWSAVNLAWSVALAWLCWEAAS